MDPSRKIEMTATKKKIMEIYPEKLYECDGENSAITKLLFG